MANEVPRLLESADVTITGSVYAEKGLGPTQISVPQAPITPKVPKARMGNAHPQPRRNVRLA